ncbi:MAG: tyrosine-type recombinase/integrase [Burkholderiales bacterium]|nr:tyrosine-type recombinase/integrase [Burkholderiales bacterium]
MRAAKPTPGKTTRLYDSGGLHLVISPTGSKAWRLKYRYNGRENRISLGAYPLISLKEARQARDDAKRQLLQGIDPSAERKARRQQAQVDATNSFQQQALEWFERQKILWVDSHTRDVERRLQANLFPDLGPLAIDRITPVQVLDTLRKMEARGAVDLAHRVMQVAAQVFRYAIACGRCATDPTSGLRGALTPHVQKHQPAIDPDELPTLLHAIDRYATEGGEAQTQRALQFLALTFVRTKELIEATWDEIDLAKAQWIITAPRMKMKRDHVVPLSTQALAILEEQQRTCRNSTYVWPGRNTRVPMSNNTLLFALYRMGYRSKMTGHGFRAVASTILNEQGWRHDVIEKQLAHEPENRVRAAYNRAEYLPERVRLMQHWGDHLDALRQGRTAQAPAHTPRLFVVNSDLTP